MTKQDVFSQRDEFRTHSLIQNDEGRDGEKTRAELSLIQNLTDERDALSKELKIAEAKLHTYEKSRKILVQRLDHMEEMIRNIIPKS